MRRVVCEGARFVAGVEDWRWRCWAGDGGFVNDDCAGRNGEVPDAMPDLGR